MAKKVLPKAMGIVERVLRKKAIGIIYNIPKNDEGLLQNKLLDEHKAVIIKGRDAYTAPMFLFRLSSKLKTKMKNLSFHMLPSLIDDKIIVVTGADIFTPSYSRVLDDAYKNKIPILLLMNSECAINEFRKLKAYPRVLTIEQDYSDL